jgi:putative peptidoglycan lipid II flippase
MGTDRTGGLMRAASLVSGATILSRLLGFVRDSLIAAYYGQTAVVDQYNAAYVIPDTLYLLLVGGAISSAFVPVVSDYLVTDRPGEAERVVNTALNAVLVGLTPLVLLGVALAPLLVRVVAIGFAKNPAAVAHTAALTRIMLVAVLFHAVNGVLVGHQYARKSFWATAVGPLFYNVAIIAVGGIFGRSGGIAAFAWGVLVGAFVNFLFQWAGVRRLGFRYRWVLDLRHPGFTRILRLMVPVMLGVGLVQLNLLINQTFLASLLPAGSINALRLASRIMLTPVSLASSLAIALLPNLTEVAARRDFVQLRRLLSLGLRLVVFLTLPAAVGLLLVGHPLIALLFRHGRFTAADVDRTARALAFYTIGTVAYGAVEVLVRGFYALKNTVTPVVVSVFVLVLGFVLNWLLLGPMAEDGLALAYSLTGWINLALLLVLLHRALVWMEGWRILRTTVRTAIAAGVMAGGVVLAHRALAPWLDGPSSLPRLAALAVVVAVGTALFAWTARRLHIEEFRLIRDRLRRRAPSVAR